MEDRTLLSTWVSKGPAPITDPSNVSGLGAQPYSGRITGLAADPTDADTIYIAAAGGGVWKTTDGGSNWTPLTENQSTLFMGSIAVAPGSDINHRIIYAGTGESNNSGDSFYGRGVLVSKDSGTTWTLTGTTVFDRRAIGKVVIDPTDATGNTAYAAVSGIPANGFTGNYGIWKTTNGGTTWTNTTAAIVSPSGFNLFTDLVMDPGRPNILYAAVGTFFGSSANGVYETTNSGRTWTQVRSFPGGTVTGRISLAIADVGMSTTLYASVSDPFFDVTLGIAKSTNGGVSWNLVMTLGSPNYINYMGIQGPYDQTLIVDPNDPTGNTVYAGGEADLPRYPLDSIIKTSNGGATWTDITRGTDGKLPHVDHHAIGFDANGRLLDGNDGGIWRLDNPNVGSIHWTDLNGNLQITQFTGIALHPTDPNIAYGGSQDNGTEEFSGSSTWNLSVGGDGGFVRIDFNNPQTVYHTFMYGPGFFQRSDNGGISWGDKMKGINTSDPANGYPPYVMDPSNPSRLLLGTDRVNETTDRADSWKPISTPNANGWVVGINPSTGMPYSIDSLAVAPSDPNTIYASAGGLVFVTTDDGASWHRRNIPNATGSISDLLVDPANSQIAYAVRDEFGGGHVFQTSDSGVTWKNISGNLPNLPTNTIVLAAGTLYIGNDDGVYFSTDGGGTWNRLGDGLPHAQVVELVLNTTLGILAAGTHGRGLWELSVSGAATHFSVTPSANPVTAGSAFQITVTALDNQNNVITGYTGTVHFASTDNGATLPGDYTFTAADAGVHVFDVTLIRAGSQTVTVTDTVSGITGDATVAVTAAAPDHLLITAPVTVLSGRAFDVTVTVQDAFANTVTSYLGTVQFTSTDNDPGVILPPAYPFTSNDAGTHTFTGGVTLITVGSQTITVDDPSLGISGAAVITVTSPAAPPGGGGANGPGGGRFRDLLGILQPLSFSPRPFVILTPTAPQTASQESPSSGIDATSVTSLFMASPMDEQSFVPVSHRVGAPARADAWEALFRSDNKLAAWTAFALYESVS